MKNIRENNSPALSQDKSRIPENFDEFEAIEEFELEKSQSEMAAMWRKKFEGKSTGFLSINLVAKTVILLISPFYTQF